MLFHYQVFLCCCLTGQHLQPSGKLFSTSLVFSVGSLIWTQLKVHIQKRLWWAVGPAAHHVSMRYSIICCACGTKSCAWWVATVSTSSLRYEAAWPWWMMYNHHRVCTVHGNRLVVSWAAADTYRQWSHDFTLISFQPTCSYVLQNIHCESGKPVNQGLQQSSLSVISHLESSKMTNLL